METLEMKNFLFKSKDKKNKTLIYLDILIVKNYDERI